MIPGDQLAGIRRKLREKRTAMGLSQFQLAQQCNIRQPTISRMESDPSRGMRMETLISVCAALGLKLSVEEA